MSSLDKKTQPDRLLLAIANALTIGRLCAAPLVVFLLMKAQQADSYRWGALGLLIALQATDILDGHLARIARRDPPHPNPAGEMLDPLADKLYLNSAYVTLALTGRFYPWAAAVIVSRDVLLILGWLLFFWLTGVRQLPNRLGKTADSLQALLVFVVLLEPPRSVLLAAAWITVIVTVLSGISYARQALGGRAPAA